MAQQTLNNGDSGLLTRTKLNENFTEVYGNTGNASETAAGKVEEATDAEAQSATAAGTLARLFINPAKLATWWTWVKTQAQTIAGLWTFTTNIAITALTAAAGKKNVIIIKDNGQLEQCTWTDVNTTLKRITKTGNSTIGTDYIEVWNDSAANLIMRLRNDRVMEMGGAAAFLVVNATVASGDAGVRFLPFSSGAGIAYRFQDTAGTDFLVFKNLTADKALTIRQVLEVNQLGEVRTERHYYIETTTTSSAQNTVFEFTLADGEHYDIKVMHCEATATDGVSINCLGFDIADCRKATGTNIEGNTVLGTKSELPASAATTAAFNWNLDTTNQKIQYRFLNHSTGKTWSVFVVVSYMKRVTPAV